MPSDAGEPKIKANAAGARVTYSQSARHWRSVARIELCDIAAWVYSVVAMLLRCYPPAVNVMPPANPPE